MCTHTVNLLYTHAEILQRRERGKVYSQRLTEEYPNVAGARQEVGSGERKCKMAHDNAFHILLNSPAQLGRSLAEVTSSMLATVGVTDLGTNT